MDGITGKKSILGTKGLVSLEQINGEVQVVVEGVSYVKRTAVTFEQRAKVI